MFQTTLYAGTSGFAYREWQGSFYPQDIAAGEMLPFYSAKLPAVEINATFYRMPSRRLMERWAGQVPDGFQFALKSPAIITHRKKLVKVEHELETFVGAASLLATHLGPFLFQLPPSLSFDFPLLQSFLELVTGYRAAFEFRHPSWFRDATYELLAKFGCALCISDRENVPEPPVVPTARFGYLRLRRDRYRPEDLHGWRERIGSQGWEEAFVFFRHEETGQGTRFAGLFLKTDPSISSASLQVRKG